MGTNGVNGNKLVYRIKSGDNLTKIARQNGTTLQEILRLNPQIKNPNLIITGHNLILSDNKPFEQKEDYSPNNMNLSNVTVGGELVTQAGGRDIKSNFFANNLSALSDLTVGDENPATKVVVEIQAGKTMTRKDNNTPYSILNKVLGDHLDNNTTVVRGENGKFVVKSEWLEKTDLYKVFISEDVNGDNFSGENNSLLPRGESGNRVQLPSVEVDNAGNKYFTLQGEKETYYFDARGRQVEFEDGLVKGVSTAQPAPEPEINPDSKVIDAPNVESEEFLVRNDNNDKLLNIGHFYLNGQRVEESSSLKSNFYANNINTFMNETLNDESAATRLDVQLNIGSNISPRDMSAVDILKKMLANNFDKSSQVTNGDNGKFKLVNTPLQDTDLYKAFVSEEINASNFADNKIVRSDAGFSIVQFPALEVDENGTKFYTLHSSTGEILYFNDKGEKI